MAKVGKQQAGYVHKFGTEYLCPDCPRWNADQKCSLHGQNDIVTIIHTCNYWVIGQPQGEEPTGALTPLESGLALRPKGASCKRCEYWDMAAWACRKVDADSPGDDPGVIHPDGCCNFQELDEVRGHMDTPQLRAFGVYSQRAGR